MHAIVVVFLLINIRSVVECMIFRLDRWFMALFIRTTVRIVTVIVSVKVVALVRNRHGTIGMSVLTVNVLKSEVVICPGLLRLLGLRFSLLCVNALRVARGLCTTCLVATWVAPVLSFPV